MALTTSLIAPNYPHSVHGLSHKISHLNLPNLINKYLFEQVHPDVNPEDEILTMQPPHADASYADHLKVFHSARVIFCAPSDPSTTTGMYHETIRATPSWNQGEIPGP